MAWGSIVSASIFCQGDFYGWFCSINDAGNTCYEKWLLAVFWSKKVHFLTCLPDCSLWTAFSLPMEEYWFIYYLGDMIKFVHSLLFIASDIDDIQISTHSVAFIISCCVNYMDMHRLSSLCNILLLFFSTNSFSSLTSISLYVLTPQSPLPCSVIYCAIGWVSVKMNWLWSMY